MFKRSLDILGAATGLGVIGPALVPVMAAIWAQDRHSPFYMGKRVGRAKKPFTMVKLRSMVIRADKSGVDSTAANDPRITGVGRFIRKLKLDEFPQLWNVLKGEMSLVGPRPNVERDVSLYTDEEEHLLDVRPGITDIASIVFADEGDILKGSDDPDLKYNQVIRPWKSRLGLLYVENGSVWLDLRLVALTILNGVSREKALAGIQKILDELGADEQLKEIARRDGPLKAYPPPGSDKVVEERQAAA